MLEEKPTSQSLRAGIVFWTVIILSLAVRFYSIDAPLLDHNSIRQVDTASIARNFYENGMRLFYPQFDGGGIKSYVECEFQLYTYTVAVLYKLFGVHEWIGRLLSIFMFYLTALYLYKLTLPLYGRSVARHAAAVFCILPLSIIVSRSFQPEGMMLFFTVAALYYCQDWMSNDSLKSELLTYAFTALTILTKLPALYLGLPLLYLIISRRGIRFLANPRLILMLVLAASAVAGWYYHSHNLWLEYRNTFIGGGNKFSDLQLLTDPKFYVQIFINRFGGVDFTPAGYLLLLSGLFVIRKEKEDGFIFYWLLSVLIYIFIAGKGNLFHNYYQFPILPVGAVLIAKSLDGMTAGSALQFALANPKRRLAGLAVLVTAFLLVVMANMAENSVRVNHAVVIGKQEMLQLSLVAAALLMSSALYLAADRCASARPRIDLFFYLLIISSTAYFIHLNDVYKVDQRMLWLGNKLASVTTEKDVIVATTESSNGQLYYAHRQGWTHFRKVPSLNVVENVRSQGATVFLTDRLKDLEKNKELSAYLNSLDGHYLGEGYMIFYLKRI